MKNYMVKLLVKYDTPFTIYAYIFLSMLINTIISGIILTLRNGFKIDGNHFQIVLLSSLFMLLEILGFFFTKIKKQTESNINIISKDTVKLKRMKKYQFYFASLEKIITVTILVNGVFMLRNIDPIEIVNTKNHFLILLIIVLGIGYLSMTLSHVYFEYIFYEIDKLSELDKNEDSLTKKISRVGKARKYRNRKR